MRLFDFESIHEMLQRFDLPIDEAKKMGIFKAEQLSPDSFAISLTFRDEKCYVLYGEDYIDSIEYVSKQIESWLPSKVTRLVKPKNPIKFEDTANSRYYLKQDHEKISQWEGYAVESGTYYIFLAQVDPDKVNEQYFIASITGGNEKIRVTKSNSENLPDEIKGRLPIDPNESFLDGWKRKRAYDD